MLHLGWRSDTSQPLPSTEETEREWRERSTKLAEPFRSMYSNVQGDLKHPCDRLAQWPTLAWDNHQGTVTLAGDAAHPMTYHRGQGLNNAAMDAANLCNAISDHLEKELPIQEVLAKYEAEVVERGHQAVIESGNNSLMLHDWEKLRQAQMFKSGVSAR